MLGYILYSPGLAANLLAPLSLNDRPQNATPRHPQSLLRVDSKADD